MKNSAIIIIDMQKGFLDNTNSSYTHGSELIVDAIVRLCSKFPRENVFFSAFVNYPSKNHPVPTKFILQSTEIEIVDQLKGFADEGNIFKKNSYSVFKIDELRKKLERFDTVYICGVEADACVLFSSAEAYDLFVNFKVVEDAVAGFTTFGGHDQFISFYRKHFGDCLVSSRDIK